MERPQAAPPDMTPKAPELVCPAGATDCHLHILGPDTRFQFHAGSKYVSADRSPNDVFSLLDRLGLMRAVFVSAAGYSTDTSQLEYVMERHGDRLIGVALLPPETNAATFRRLGALGVKAIRFVNPDHGGAVPPICKVNAARAADAGWHVHYYPYRDELAHGTDHLTDLPCDVVVDHFAHIPAKGGADQPAMDGVCRLLDSGRFWVKLSGPMRVSDQPLRYDDVVPMGRRLVKHRVDRLLWASDWPHVNMSASTIPNDAELLDQLLRWAPEPADQARILSDNPAALFGPA